MMLKTFIFVIFPIFIVGQFGQYPSNLECRNEYQTLMGCVENVTVFSRFYDNLFGDIPMAKALIEEINTVERCSIAHEFKCLPSYLLLEDMKHNKYGWEAYLLFQPCIGNIGANQTGAPCQPHPGKHVFCGLYQDSPWETCMMEEVEKKTCFGKIEPSKFIYLTNFFYNLCTSLKSLEWSFQQIGIEDWLPKP